MAELPSSPLTQLLPHGTIEPIRGKSNFLSVVGFYLRKDANTMNTVKNGVLPTLAPSFVFSFLLVLAGCDATHRNEERAQREGLPKNERPNPPSSREAVAVAEIQRLGGKVLFDEKAAGRPVYSVNFGQTGITNDAMKSVEELPELKVLILDDTKVTDAGLKCIRQLPQLRSLLLMNTGVTDAGLKNLKTLVHLETLLLDNTRVSDTGLEQIGGLTELRRLSLSGTRITDAGLKHLRRLNDLVLRPD